MTEHWNVRLSFACIIPYLTDPSCTTGGIPFPSYASGEVVTRVAAPWPTVVRFKLVFPPPAPMTAVISSWSEEGLLVNSLRCVKLALLTLLALAAEPVADGRTLLLVEDTASNTALDVGWTSVRREYGASMGAGISSVEAIPVSDRSRCLVPGLACIVDTRSMRDGSTFGIGDPTCGARVERARLKARTLSSTPEYACRSC